VIGHVWSLPNTLVGLVFGLGGRFELDVENRVFVVTGGWMAGIFGKLGYAGMCVGDVVLCAGPLSMNVYRHELIHAVQARILGPLYLPLTLLGYLYGYLRFPQNAHDASPLEVWADVASGNRKSNAYLTRTSSAGGG
jgi:hypothetical protein